MGFWWKKMLLILGFVLFCAFSCTRLFYNCDICLQGSQSSARLAISVIMKALADPSGHIMKRGHVRLEEPVLRGVRAGHSEGITFGRPESWTPALGGSSFLGMCVLPAFSQQEQVLRVQTQERCVVLKPSAQGLNPVLFSV